MNLMLKFQDAKPDCGQPYKNMANLFVSRGESLIISMTIFRHLAKKMASEDHSKKNYKG